MNYGIFLPNNCSCNSQNQGIYGTNMWNVNGNNPGNSTGCGHQQACNGCIDTPKGKCVIYTGTNLLNTGINQNDTLDQVLLKIDTVIGIQNQKNANILAALNDINTRINTLAGGTPHAPYTLL